VNELIVNADGTVTVVGDAGSVNGILAELVEANTTPAELNDDGSVKTAAVVPDVATLAVEVTPDELKTHAWRVPKARTERLEVIRNDRNTKLTALDLEYQLADEGVHPDGLTKTQVAAKKVTLRDLPPKVTTALADLNNTDDIDAYVPDELK
ncbi:uncharacterized protein METZ01_LOCUS390049, partial [marine metagenome]